VTDRRQADLAHQPPDPLAADAPALATQMPRHLARAIPGHLNEHLVDDAHQFEVLGALARRLSLERRPRDRDQFPLAADREPWVIGINHHSPPIQAQRSEALAKKIPLDDELADLGMQLRHLGLPADLRIRSLVVERLGQILDGLPFPLRDLVRVKLMLRGQFRNRPLTADRLKRNPGLELSRKPSARLHRGSSFSSVDPP